MTSPPELDKIDRLLDVINHCSPPDEAGYAHEHLQEARTYLLGAMPVEFQVSLDLARKTMARLDDTKERQEAETMLENISKS